MKTIFNILFLLLAILLPFTANAYDFEVDGIYYNILGDNEVEVTSGRSYTGDVTIPTTVIYDSTTYSVTSIGEGAFYNCTGLTSIEIPNSVTNIRGWAFYNCSGLTSIEIPNSVTNIGEWAFTLCYGLKNLDIPNSVTSIGEGAFTSCCSLTILDIPNSVTSIGETAFYDCWGLTSVTIGNSVTSIGDRAFDNCTGLTRIEIPNSVTSIGYNAFSGTAWYNNQLDGLVYAGKVAYKYKGTMPTGTIIELEEGTLGIASRAFEDCSGLTNVTIPNSVISIGAYAFSGCSNIQNKQIIFPESVRSIGSWAFYNTYLTQISFEGGIDYLEDDAFRNDENAGHLQLLAFYGNINNSIGDKVFWYGRYTSATQRYIDKLIIGVKVDSIKGMNLEPGDEIYSYNPVPPVADENTFLSYGSTTVHVPATSLAAYFTAPYWCNFANIVGDAVTPKEVTIDKDSIEVNIGDQFSLSGAVAPANATPNEIIWASTNNSIATVYNGQVSAVGVGECDIIARCLNKKAICHVVVNDTTVTITLDQQEAMVLPNHIITFTPSASPVMPDLVVSSSDPTVAATRLVNGKVQVVGIKEGTTTITVGSTDGKAVPATCLVTVYTEPGDVNMDGFVNISDVTQMIDYLLGSEVSIFKEANADLNGDDSVTIGDVTALIDLLLSAGN